jgi:hypothetical protein
MRYATIRTLNILAIAAFSVVHAETPPPRVELTVSGRPVVLENAAAVDLAQRVKAAVSTCELNSIETPDAPWVPKPSPSAKWASVMATGHLYVAYPDEFSVISWSGKAHPVSEVLLGIGARDDLLGPTLTRTGERVVKHAKCSGTAFLRIQCSEPLVSVLGETYKSNCAHAR